MTDAHQSDDGTGVDDGIRQVMTALARSAPEPPPLPSPGAVRVAEVRVEPGRRRSLAVAAAVLALIGGGITWAVMARRDTAQPVATEAVTVAHQQIRWTQEVELSCEGGTGAGTVTAEVDLWVDLAGERVRQRVTYADGAAVRDQIWEGPPDRPARKFERGSSAYVGPTCPDWGPAAVDDTLGMMSRLAGPGPDNTPGDSSGRRLVVAGEHTDEIGRTAELTQEESEGIAQLDDGGESAGVPFLQTTEWYTEPGTGRLLQRTDRFELEGVYRVTATMVVLSDDDVATPEPGLFDTSGYELVYEAPALDGRHVTAEPVVPSVAVGPDRYWPAEPVPGDDAEATARRFATEVLRWDDPSVAPASGPDDGGAWEVAVGDRRGHTVELTFWPIPSGGWELLRIDSSGVAGSLTPDGSQLLDLPFPVGTTEVVIEGHVSPGGPRAWRAEIADATAGVILPGTEGDPMIRLIVLYRDAEARTIGADVVGSGGPTTDVTEALGS